MYLLILHYAQFVHENNRLVQIINCSMGGLILDKAEQRFAPLALYQPVINGVGGNLVSVQASRISTRLHRDCAKGQLPQGLVTSWGSPFDVYLKRGTFVN